MWSVDARVLARPAPTFRAMAARPAVTGHFVAWRRPIFVAFVLGCVVSLIATGSLTLRLAGSATIYWAYVPATEVLALMAVLGRRRNNAPLGRLVDTFFAGHGAWTLFLILLAGILLQLSPAHWWLFITRTALALMTLVICWSAYVDFCFFRFVTGATRPGAIRDVILHRLITWPVVFAIFALPLQSPLNIVSETVQALREIF